MREKMPIAGPQEIRFPLLSVPLFRKQSCPFGKFRVKALEVWAGRGDPRAGLPTARERVSEAGILAPARVLGASGSFCRRRLFEAGTVVTDGRARLGAGGAEGAPGPGASPARAPGAVVWAPSDPAPSSAR